MPYLELEPFGLTDAGKVRKNNEDAMLVGDGRDETLFAVADGIGGFEAGEVASRIAVDALKELEPGGSFESAIREANRRILAAARGDERLNGMGTTVVAVRFAESGGDPVAEVAHVGDSRAYVLRGGRLRPITEDHSLVAELVRSGDLTRAQAAEHPQKNLITRALGAEDEVNIDTEVIPIEAGDRILLCSDGLTDMVPETRVAEILLESAGDPETPARRLVSAALDAGGSDNVTVVVVDVKRHEPPPPPPREDRSGGTREMRAVPRPEGWGESRPSRREARRPKGSRRPSGSGKRRRGGWITRIVRGLALVLVVVVALTPAYLWAGSRYFLDLESGEVVVYRGLPYAPMGIELNEEWRRTELEISEVKEPYRERIRDNRLYTQEEIVAILRDLRK
ncbi:MAG: Stp1/IreP family PP2C-type Ser/Thr phosphatase [Actinomycetota bacterium]